MQRISVCRSNICSLSFFSFHHVDGKFSYAKRQCYRTRWTQRRAHVKQIRSLGGSHLVTANSRKWSLMREKTRKMNFSELRGIERRIRPSAARKKSRATPRTGSAFNNNAYPNFSRLPNFFNPLNRLFLPPSRLEICIRALSKRKGSHEGNFGN